MPNGVYIVTSNGANGCRCLLTFFLGRVRDPVCDPVTMGHACHHAIDALHGHANPQQFPTASTAACSQWPLKLTRAGQYRRRWRPIKVRWRIYACMPWDAGAAGVIPPCRQWNPQKLNKIVLNYLFIFMKILIQTWYLSYLFSNNKNEHDTIHTWIDKTFFE